jgi:hypothetical protein
VSYVLLQCMCTNDSTLVQNITVSVAVVSGQEETDEFVLFVGGNDCAGSPRLLQTEMEK